MAARAEAKMMPLEPKAGVTEALDELVELLRAAAPGVMPRRDAAGRYMVCRELLLMARIPLPGFLVQCGSLYKFAEFITLYDPRVEARVAFVESQIAACRPASQPNRVYDVFSDV